MKLDFTPDDVNNQYLGTITKDFVKVADFLKEGSHQMRSRKISEYPIFPISKNEIAIGQIIVSRQQTGLSWHYYISMGEELVQRELIPEDHMPDFIQAYKNPEEFCCLLVVDEEFTNIVFLPYPED